MSVAEAMIQVGLLGEAIDHGPFAVLVADEDRRYVAVNQTACRLLGYSREELLQLSIDEVVVDPDPEADFIALIHSRRKSGRSTLRRKDGSLVVFEYDAGETSVAGMHLYLAIGSGVTQ
jgi:PAS domain S-box-containing protein